MTLPEDDQALFKLIGDELCTAVVGDVLDAAGFAHQFLRRKSGRSIRH